MFDKVIHRWLRVPYTLYVREFRAPKKPRATVVMLHGIGNTGEAWKKVADKLPEDISIIAVDLLGFGLSPRPSWTTYSTMTQARSVMLTLLKLRMRSPVVLVGHSLGSLVAIEIAKRYPFFAASLILCSPPFYELNAKERRILPHPDSVLRNLYRTVRRYPERFLKMASVAMRYKLINESFNVTDENVATYMNTLEAAIINQSSIDDVRKVRLPVQIIRGTLDPVVVARNVKKLAKMHDTISLKEVVASHEIKGLFVGAVSREIIRAVDESQSSRRLSKKTS